MMEGIITVKSLIDILTKVSEENFGSLDVPFCVGRESQTGEGSFFESLPIDIGLVDYVETRAVIIKISESDEHAKMG